MLCSPIVTPHQATAGNGTNSTTSTANGNITTNNITTSASSRTLVASNNTTNGSNPVVAKMAHQQRNHNGFMTTTTTTGTNGTVASTKIGRNSTSTINISITNNNNNSVRQQNFETSMTHTAIATTTTSENARKSESSELDGPITTTIREIKSRNIGLLSPLCQSTAANLNVHHSNGINPANSTTNSTTTNNSNIVERRQAISMERLNSIHATTTTSPTSRYLSQIQSTHRLNRSPASQNNSGYLICKENNSGSLSSGSNSSIDESASDAEQPDQFNHLDNHRSHHNHQHYPHHHHLHKRLLTNSSSCVLDHDDRSSGLSRSASRVSRFKSAKEFFERLSTAGHQANVFQQSPQLLQQQQQQQVRAPINVKPIKRSPERQQVQQASTNQARGNVASRYIEPLAASLSHLATPSPSKQSNHSSLSSPHINTLLHSSSPAINLQPIGTTLTSINSGGNSIKGTFATPSRLLQSPIKTTASLSSNATNSNKTDSTSSSVNIASSNNNNSETESNTSQAATDSPPPAPTAVATTKLQNTVTNGGVVPLPRSLSLSASSSSPAPSIDTTDQQATTTTTSTCTTPTPLPPRSLSLPLPSNSSTYVKLKTTDHSGLSTNTILHINNSHLSCNNNNNNNNNGKSVINGCSQPMAAEVAVLAFRGDNVIVGSGSLLVRRNKQLRIKFDENTVATFEYPSEEAMMMDEQLTSSESINAPVESAVVVASASAEPEVVVESPSDDSHLSTPEATMPPAPPALQSTGGLLPNQRLMWRQSFGLLLSNKSLTGAANNDILIESVDKSNNDKQTSDRSTSTTGPTAPNSSSCFSAPDQEVKVAEDEDKDNRWKGEW